MHSLCWEQFHRVSLLTVGVMQVDMTGIDAVQKVMEEFAPDTPKRRTLQERKAMLAKGKRWAPHAWTHAIFYQCQLCAAEQLLA